MGDTLDLTNVFNEYMGALYSGDIKLTSSSLIFKNRTSGRVNTINNDDVDTVDITYLANQPGIRIMTKNGDLIRYGGLSDSMVNKAKAFISTKWRRDVGTHEISIKGWNFGELDVVGKNIQFKVDNATAFEIPLYNVSNCSASKSEAVVELHVNDDCPVGLSEIRFHIPMIDGEDIDVPAEDFRDRVMKYVGNAAETEQPIVMLPQMPLVTPRGRYDVKIFPTFLSFHGKTYDYKIPSKTVNRLFMLPHKDNRRTFFVMHVNPPIRQGQTRYSYLVFEFNNEERQEVELSPTIDQLRTQYDAKIEKRMNGPLHQIVAKLFRVFVGIKVTVPSTFNNRTEPITCSHRQSHGFFYLMDKGFMYVPKPPIFISFEEIANIDFARSDVSTKTFDLEFSTKAGASFTFSSLGKDDFDPLLAFCKEKNLPVKDVKKLAKATVTDFGKNNDIDAGYKQRLAADAASSGDDDDDSDEDDDDYDLAADERRRAKKQAADSDGTDGTEPDEEYDTPSDVASDEEPKTKKSKHKESSEKKSKDRSEKPSKTTKKGKKEKDPNAPKRGQTAFFIWLNENRPKFAKGGASVTEVTKEAGRVWKEMSESDKAPWEAKSKKDKERYERQMAEYKASGGDASSSKSKKQSSSTSSPRKSASSTLNTTKSPTKGAKSKEYLSTSDDDSSSDDEKAKKKSKKTSGSGDKKKTKEPTPSSSELSTDSD